MKKNYFKWLPQGIFAVAFLCFNISNAQVQFRLLDGFGKAVLDINDSGKAAQSGGIYDFTTDTTEPIEEGVSGISGINNAGDLIGTIPLDRDGEMYSQPAYRKGGIWTPIGFPEGSTVDAGFSLGQISENSNYVTGQISADCCDFQAFLFNISTGNLEVLRAPNSEYGAGYTVNNNGVAGGWYDPLPEGTIRVASLITTGSVFTNIPSGLPGDNDFNQVSSVNNAGLAVGDRNNKPFIYDSTTGTFTEFEIPAGYENATFTSVSDNGIAVGYAQSWATGSPVREGIIYNPSLGSQPIFISTILAAHGVEVTTYDGMLGTPIAISPDGNFIGGWENGFFFFASGWIINLDDLLFSSCFIQCPSDITTVSLNGPKVVNYTMNVICSSNPSTSLVLVSGPESGSAFPVGTTEVVHNLVDENNVVVSTCTFNVIVSDQYCTPEEMNVEAITLVKIADLNNVTAVESTDTYENFTAMTANVTAGQTYDITCEGFTGGEYTDVFTAYADWNHDGEFSNLEATEIGTITFSDGVDGQQATSTISVPTDAYIGTTALRVVKTYGDPSISACAPGSGFGQVEDYTLNISPALATQNFSRSALKLFPNPVKDILNVSNTEAIESITVFNILGQEVLSKTVKNTSGQLNVSMLPAGNYLAKVTTTSAVQTIKIVKQ
ncbi:hypothetical protein FNO01nite_00940 [Flavobacterium noncentrifugens]|uniref:Por secretion system C-terminal sorting domain-containing protein n=1 Tax=Flavobacterium noncentrifugens TaxID=1128970 RepID=A0A1G8RG53_9FLAO|nr:GEVED domain-containing protein [Flavobacterium noncentrifugens]GEP49422.1 hypothetical protein FNO01nite_00940 [Flavobacterium noncentrifugens]SDJ15942.1 Por secretion system C-terminal sorting domain-containing protein [Flavobacterium noncentrifugens]